ncbi:MAG TPA: 6-phosphogluconolactonase [Chitinophagales bacterium]|nr:6-phosphogluconolactonase [Chitinophagales bacterium]
MDNYELLVYEDLQSLARACAQMVLEASQQAVKAGRKFTIALSGGNTPATLFKTLAAEPYSTQMPWASTCVFWGDERCVPLYDENNNAHNAIELLLSRVNIPPENIFRIPVNLPPAKAAEQYENELKAFFETNPPQFDVILLGLGNDGHTASLFPASAALKEKNRLVLANYLHGPNVFRITLTYPVINAAHKIVFMVSGKTKSTILKSVLQDNKKQYPAQVIQPEHGKLIWMVDKDAAQDLQAV